MIPYEWQIWALAVHTAVVLAMFVISDWESRRALKKDLADREMYAEKDEPEVDARIKRPFILVGLLLTALCYAIGLAFWVLLYSESLKIIWQMTAPADQVFFISPIAWVLPSMLLAALGFGAIGDVLFKTIFGPSLYHDLNRAFVNQDRSQRTTMIFLLWAVRVLVVPLLILPALFFGWFVRVGDNQIEHSDFLSISSEQIQADEVAAIWMTDRSVAMSGSGIVEDPTIVVEFVDGGSIRFQWMYFFNQGRMKESFENFATRNDLPIHAVDLWPSSQGAP